MAECSFIGPFAAGLLLFTQFRGFLFSAFDGSAKNLPSNPQAGPTQPTRGNRRHR